MQGIGGSQKLESVFSMLSNNHCKELPVAKAFKLWEPAVPYNESRKASENINSNFWEPAIPCKFQDLETGSSLVTFGSHVRNHQFQPLGTGVTGSSLQW